MVNGLNLMYRSAGVLSIFKSAFTAYRTNSGRFKVERIYIIEHKILAITLSRKPLRGNFEPKNLRLLSNRLLF